MVDVLNVGFGHIEKTHCIFKDEKVDQPTKARIDGCSSHSFTVQAQPFGQQRSRL